MGKRGRLLALFHHRWNIPVLAEIHRASGTRFVVLVNRLGVSRDSLTHTLDALVQARWVRRNPGYGHPLRPEYILTKPGSRLAPHCQTLHGELRSRQAEEIGLRKWPMPVLLSIAEGARRFADLKSILPGITARALSLALRDLQDAALIKRIVLDAYPPATRYEVTAHAESLVFEVGEMMNVV
jgi:DNA-binding HxlR family transcriptional regulator